MEIIDKRKSTSWVPAVKVLDQAIPVLRKENFRGIRNIVLMDQDYRNNQHEVGGRYCRIEGTNRADIEIFFNWYEDLPDELKNSYLYVFYQVVSTLLHEIYHHIVRGQKRLKKPSDKKEEAAADKRSEGGAMFAIKQVFPREQHEEEWNRIKETIRQERIKLGLDVDPDNI